MVSESDGTVTFEIVRMGESDVPVSVQFSTADGSAQGKTMAVFVLVDLSVSNCIAYECHSHSVKKYTDYFTVQGAKKKKIGIIMQYIF